MPTFCRHNRFIERCPICKRTIPGAEPEKASRRSAREGEGAGVRAAGGPGARARRLRARGHEVRIQREARAEDDGYGCALVPGLHASREAERLAEEIAFASGRLARMHAAPPDLFGEIRARASEGPEGVERATWICFLTVYLSPLQGDDPFVGVRLVLERERELVQGRARENGDGRDRAGEGGRGWDSPLDGVPLGPRTSHEPGRGSETLRAYRQWALHAGSQAKALTGEESWTAQRRFERAFERLALPGFGRAGRYELLVTLGRLGVYELQADALHLAVGRGAGGEDLTTLAAKRLLAVADPIYLERRALAFAADLGVPVDVLDLAFANWAAGERATLGFHADTLDRHTLEHVRAALEL
jgi:hypothetical protein